MPRNKKKPLDNALPFECFEVKVEPLDEDDEESASEPEMALPSQLAEKSRSAAVTSVGVQTLKRPIMSRAVQVDPQSITTDTFLEGMQPLEGLDDGPLKSGAAADRQCRICLRRLPESSLTYFKYHQKTKIHNVLGLKIYLGDAYQFICRNCSGLVDLMFDFRNTCLRAKKMLVHERKSIENNDWDSAKNLEIVEQCRALVEGHKRDIDAAYEQFSSHKLDYQAQPSEEVVVKPEVSELILLEQSTSKQSAVEEKKSSSKKDKDDCSNHSRKIDLKREPEVPELVLLDHSTSKESMVEEVDKSSPVKDKSHRPSNRSRKTNLKTEPEGSDFSATDDEDVEYKQPSAEDKDDQEAEFDKISSEDAADPDDFAPSLSSLPRKRRVRAAKKPNKKQVKKEVTSTKARQKDGEDKEEKKEPRRQGSLCDLCGKWVWQKMMESHVNTHLGVKPYSCQTEGCGSSFTSRVLLTLHIKRNHGAVGYQDCDICGARIKALTADLRKHRQTHSQEKNFVCNICGKGFANLDYLRKHGYVHSDQMQFECSVCDRKFNNKYNMLSHEKKHFQKGEAAALPPSGLGGSHGSTSQHHLAPFYDSQH